MCVLTRHSPGEVAPVHGSLREGRQTDEDRNSRHSSTTRLSHCSRAPAATGRSTSWRSTTRRSIRHSRSGITPRPASPRCSRAASSPPSGESGYGFDSDPRAGAGSPPDPCRRPTLHRRSWSASCITRPVSLGDRPVGWIEVGRGGEGIERYGNTPELPVDNTTKLAYCRSYKMDPIVPAGMVGQNERVGR